MTGAAAEPTTGGAAMGPELEADDEELFAAEAAAAALAPEGSTG